MTNASGLNNKNIVQIHLEQTSSNFKAFWTTLIQFYLPASFQNSFRFKNAWYSAAVKVSGEMTF